MGQWREGACRKPYKMYLIHPHTLVNEPPHTHIIHTHVHKHTNVANKNFDEESTNMLETQKDCLLYQINKVHKKCPTGNFEKDYIYVYAYIKQVYSSPS